MKKFFEKILGIDKLKQEALDTIKAAEEAQQLAKELVNRAEEEIGRAHV